MAARIAAHQARRPAGWTTLDVEMDLAAAVAAVPGVALVDCLTLWLTHVVLADRSVEEASGELLAALHARRGPVVAVSNEVGEGIVPATSLGRRFRDHQGVLNRRVAEAATDVVKVVAGCPIVIKPRPEPEIRL